jgi:chaperonin GroES
LTQSDSKRNKQLLVVGDRILILPDEAKARTDFGLYLPQGVEEKEKIHGGFVVKVGPGYPLPDPGTDSDAPWSSSNVEPKYLPLQFEEGDYVIFMRKSALEVEYEGKKYMIMPQSAILLIIRDDILNLDQDS